MNKYIIKFSPIHGKAWEYDYAIRCGISEEAAIKNFLSIRGIENFKIDRIDKVTEPIELEEVVDLKTEIEKLKASAKEMLETLEKIKL